MLRFHCYCCCVLGQLLGNAAALGGHFGNIGTTSGGQLFGATSGVPTTSVTGLNPGIEQIRALINSTTVTSSSATGSSATGPAAAAGFPGPHGFQFRTQLGRGPGGANIVRVGGQSISHSQGLTKLI